MPVRLCAEPSCPHPAKYRGRCTTHAQAANRATHRNRSIYNSKRWQILRRWFLFDNPLCHECGRIATDVHHKHALAAGGAPYDPYNLETLCHQCHSRKTRQEQNA